ncbi:S8 family serine peptidase [Mesorhizobium sp. L48C026A00]|uniref:S8 family serine peptidase n=1 Tax=Mesorhizobium sp. L48C026A00 TaxID=1287182 RepID=UPI0003CFE8AA|nr:S8 family serine peptidase [Mesorhizobium sp. L48C026A00]ESZ10160.1 hypothetical protein X737_32170 [Mesorhizobium sp. L48C026A00]
MEEDRYIFLRVPDFVSLKDINTFAIDRTLSGKSPIGLPKGLGRSLDQAENRRRAMLNGGVQIVSTSDAKLAADLRGDPRTIEGSLAMPTCLVKPLTIETPEEDAGDYAWGIEAVGALDAPGSGAGVKVAVLDTGIDKAHETFRDKTIVEQDFTGEGSGDRNGHGTHCAATFFGGNVSNVRIGVAPGVSDAFIGKVLRDDGSGDVGMLVQGLNAAVGFDADVISISVGFDFPGYVKRLMANKWDMDLAIAKALVVYRDNLRVLDGMLELIRHLGAMNRGAVVVAAAGNDSRSDDRSRIRIPVSLPAAADGIISVGALERHAGGLWVPDFSNTLPRLVAPGVAVLSAKARAKEGDSASALDTKTGTSMACPHVAGVAALWSQFLGRASPDEVEQHMLESARNDVFAPDVQPTDRGEGLVAAPRI